MKSSLMISFVLIAAACSNISSEKAEKSLDDIELRILNERLYLKENQILINVEVINNTDSTFLMFSFESLHESLSKEAYYANDNLNYPSGHAMFIHDKEGKALKEHPLPDDYVDFDDLKKMKKKSDNAYIDRMLLLKANESVKIPLQINLKYYRPDPGEYSVYLIYYSGKNLYNFVPEDTVKMYQEKYSAKEFRGWLKSDTVKLIVE